MLRLSWISVQVPGWIQSWSRKMGIAKTCCHSCMEPMSHIFYGTSCLTLLKLWAGQGLKTVSSSQSLPFLYLYKESSRVPPGHGIPSRGIYHLCISMANNFPPRSQPTNFSSEPQIHTSNLLRPRPFGILISVKVSKVSQTQLAPHLSHLNEKTHYSLTVKTRHLDAAFDHSPLTYFLSQNRLPFPPVLQLHCERLPKPHMSYPGTCGASTLVLQTDPGRMLGAISHTGLETAMPLTCLLGSARASLLPPPPTTPAPR